MVKRLLVITLLLMVPLYSASAAELESILSSCAKDSSHINERECLTKKARSSEVALESTELLLLKHISKRDDEPDLVTTMKNSLSAATRAFKVYRDKECEFYTSMAAGGNGGEDLHLACIAALNTRRAEQLEWATDYWK
jgi:uncharacterized protein YecT (DUF1311 family)